MVSLRSGVNWRRFGMRPVKVLLSALAIAVCACTATGSVRDKRVPSEPLEGDLCKILENPGSVQGRLVRLRSTIREGSHYEILLIDENCPDRAAVLLIPSRL